MILFFQNIFQNIFLLVFFTFTNIHFNCNSAQAQDTTITKSSTKPETANIQWLSQWSSAEGKHKANGAANWIKDFIFGKNIHKLSKPVSILVNNQNTFWILDQGNNTIFQVSKGVGKIPRFIEKKNIYFSSLVGICNFHPASNRDEILFTDSYLNKVFLVNPEKKECRVFNDSLVLGQPTGIAYSKIKNEIWVVETRDHRISILNEKGQLIKRIGHRGNARGEFNFPTHIWIDKVGNVYVVDALNFRVQVLNKEGAVISVFGSNGDATGYFASPKGIATDSYGHIYVADALFHTVQIFDINGNFLFNFGSQGYGQGQFWMPSGIYIDDSDRIYVADSYNSRIQIFQLVTVDRK